MSLEISHEPIVWVGQPAWAEYAFLWFVSVIFFMRGGLALWLGQSVSVFVYVLGVALFGGLAIFLRQRTFYKVTRQSIYKSQGVFGKTNIRFPLNEISEVKIWKGPIDQLFGIGTVSFKIKAGKIERLIGIKDPEVVERKIKALL